MIRLEDVSTSGMLASFAKTENGLYEDPIVARALASCNVKDYRQLEQLIDSSNPNFNNEIFRTWLDLTRENIDYANQVGVEPEIFLCNNYQGSNIDGKTIKVTEGKTFCRQLAINNPILGPSEKMMQISSLRIYDAKALLGKVVAHDKLVVGKNAFLDSNPIFTEEDALRIVNGINFFEQQIERQFLETGKKGICLFGINKEQRERIIKDEIEDIVDYLVTNAEECMWGKLTSAQKQMLVSAMMDRKDRINNKIIQRLINILCNYTTLSEIEGGVKQKTLDRFIVSKK